MHNVLDLFYPGYAASSYHHNETGFITPTPFGDGVDVLLADASLDLLARYPVLFVATPIISSVLETRLKLEQYVRGGGQLVCRGTLQSLAHCTTTFPDFPPQNLYRISRNFEGETLGGFVLADRW